MTENQGKRGGAGKGQGRKAVAPGEPSIIIKPTLSASQARKYERLGGHAWLRRQIDAAPEPSSGT